MGAVGVVWKRTMGALIARPVCCFVGLLFLAVCGFYAGRRDVVPLLVPVLAVLVSMGLWSAERRSGRMDILLSSAVRERSYVLGKFLGSLTLLVVLIAISLVVTWRAAGPSASAMAWQATPAFFILVLQGALWCALTGFASALFASAATAAVISILLYTGLRAAGTSALFPGGMPFDVHFVDFASGTLSSGTVVFYLASIAALLFLTSKTVVMRRLVGRGARGIRFSTRFACLLAVVLAVLVCDLGFRLDVRVDIPGHDQTFSERTCEILASSRGEITVTCLLPRGDPRYKDVARFLRAVQYRSSALGGAEIVCRFVDPNRDVGGAGRLAERGITENSLVWEKNARRVVLPIDDGLNERACASAIMQLTMPVQRRTILWTTGHAEIGFDDYGPWGMSDMARAFTYEGFENRAVDLQHEAQIPSDCALVVIAGAKDAFSRDEKERLESYLAGGGRLLLLAGSVGAEGFTSLLAGWGVRIESEGTVRAEDEILPCRLSDHPIAKELAGSRLLLRSPISFAPLADRRDVGPYHVLADADDADVAIALEHGTGAGIDLAVRPMRIVIVGDAGFAGNAQLRLRGNANRDFLLNCVAYLAGVGRRTDR